MPKPRVLFVCLGNICRSPLAEGAFRQAASDAGLEAGADSAGTANYHVGKLPDERSIAAAREHGVDITAQRARQLAAADYTRFTHIFALDEDNLADIRARAPKDATAEIALLMDAVPGQEGEAVADPYYGGPEGFQQTWREVRMAAEALVARFTR
ncbi:low molecular weight protein-tyrosine-phosphatase [Paraurantiacibacter namhicola]|nr:low molecular weight protein-tyrosine-phosphatase [Paraurantiacibacter namhicola]